MNSGMHQGCSREVGQLVVSVQGSEKVTYGVFKWQEVSSGQEEGDVRGRNTCNSGKD